MTGHTIFIENQETITITAVTDVKNFDSDSVEATLSEGILEVHGKELRIVGLEPENGRLVLSGRCSSLNYKETKGKHKKSLWQRIWK